MKNIIVFCACLLILVSCNETSRVYTIGRQVVSSKPERVVSLNAVDCIDGLCLEGAASLPCCADSILVISLVQAQNCYRALNVNTMEYVDFLHKGRGPNEVIAGFFSDLRKADGRWLLDITAINEGVLLTIDLGQTFRDGHAVVSEKRTLLQNSYFSYPLGDLVLSEVRHDVDRISYKVYDWRDQKITKSIQPFGAEDYVELCEPLFDWVGRLKPDGKKMCMGMFSFDEVDIFDIYGEDHLSISTSKTARFKTVIKDALEFDKWGEQAYYVALTVTDDIILALYGDGSDSSTKWASSTIHAFSWEGQLKAIYHLDRPVTSIAVSADGKSLYGLTTEEVLCRYDLSQ